MDLISCEFLQRFVLNTAQNTAVSPNFMVWKFCGKVQFPHTRNCAFPQNFHTMKLGEITVFYAVKHF